MDMGVNVTTFYISRYDALSFVLKFADMSFSTEAWINLFNGAESTIDIAAYLLTISF